jgi:hypothetical protein
MKKLIMLGAFCAISSSAQTFSVGVIGGAPFTDVVSAVNQNNLAFLPTSSHFTVGTSFQLNLPLSFRIEVDALYRPYSFSATSTVQPPLATSTAPINVSGSEWRFPVLAQYRFHFPLVSPFVEGGVSFNHLANLSGAIEGLASGSGELLRQTNAGVVLGGGVDLKIPFVRLSGELRYTHEGGSYFRDISNVNQAEVLIGVHF